MLIRVPGLGFIEDMLSEAFSETRLGLSQRASVSVIVSSKPRCNGSVVHARS